jgi:hypothetical protein
MAEWFPLPKELEMPHQGHGAHLCVAQTMNYIQTNLEGYKKLVRDGQYVCKNCGRVAHNAENVCAPDKL